MKRRAMHTHVISLNLFDENMCTHNNIHKAQEKKCSNASTEESQMKTELFLKKKGIKSHVVQYNLLSLPFPDESSGEIQRKILTSANLW